MSSYYLSIIVPAYNIEKYIEKSLRSFMEIDPTYQDKFEVIIINDGSIDQTKSVIQHLINNHQFNNIKLIDKANGGHGSTINLGIQEAKGTYFKVIDGDDWVSKEPFEKFLDKLIVAEEDLIITDFTKQFVLDNKEEIVKPLAVNTANHKQNGIPSVRIPMHSVTYKTSVLKDNKIRVSEGIFYVDIQYTIFPLLYVKTWVYYPLNIYQYLLGRSDQSVNIESYVKHAKHHLMIIDTIIEFGKISFSDNQLKQVVKDTLQGLVDMQLIINYVSPEKDVLMRQLFTHLNAKTMDYSFKKARKISALIYAQEKWPILSPVFRPIISRKISRL